MSAKLKREIAVALGVVAAVLEAVSTSLPPGSLRDVAQAVIPILAAVGVRSQVSPT